MLDTSTVSFVADTSGKERIASGNNSMMLGRHPNKMLVAQIGARMHYAVPRILHEAGMLGVLHTDVVATMGWPALLARMIPGSKNLGGVRRLLARVPQGIPNSKIRTQNKLGVSFAIRNQYCRTITEAEAVHLQVTKKFGRTIVKSGMEDFDGVYVFSGDGVEILEEAKRLGQKRIVEQVIAPMEIVYSTYAGEHERYPDMVGKEYLNQHWTEIRDRECREWELADVVVCGSTFVQDCIQQVGGPVEKTVVVNYGVGGPVLPSRTVPNRPGRKTRVVFVGEVGFRKGAHYLLEAARELTEDFEFRFCGGVSLPERFLSRIPSNVKLMGIVPRSEVGQQYAWADIFCLPSLVEGSATVTYEAMAAGLPVVTTPQSGSIVRDGIDGFLIPPGQVEAITDGLMRCRRGDLPLHWEPIRDRVDGPASFTLDAYRERLLRLVQSEV
ncbi:glycosyltransferase family 4 protein [bacterium]|nr:glycosyltransferase family 4 protein [bacterium]